MAAETTGPADPLPSEFAGDSAGQTARRLFHATRPKFFPASVLPVVAGTAWGVAAADGFEPLVFIVALIATICVHAGANVLNDVGDEQIGTDRQNDKRIYPYTGGSRFIQSGIMDQSAMARLGITLLTVASFGGFVLLWIKGPMVLAFGIAGVALAVLYSLGPLRLSGLGLGELAVAIGFGVLPVSGAAWLQSGQLDPPLFYFSMPISAWVAAILLINEVPDIEADSAAGKRTLPVRLGLGGTAMLYATLQALPLAVTTLMAIDGNLPPAAPLVPAALLVWALRSAPAIRHGLAGRVALTRAIEATLGIHTIGTLWLAGVALYGFLATS